MAGDKLGYIREYPASNVHVFVYTLPQKYRPQYQIFTDFFIDHSDSHSPQYLININTSGEIYYYSYTAIGDGRFHAIYICQE